MGALHFKRLSFSQQDSLSLLTFLKHSAMENQPIKFLDMRDPVAMQEFMLREVDIGKRLLWANKIDEGVERLFNALAVCGRRGSFLMAMKNEISDDAYVKLAARMQKIGEHMAWMKEMRKKQVEEGPRPGSWFSLFDNPPENDAPRHRHPPHQHYNSRNSRFITDPNFDSL